MVDIGEDFADLARKLVAALQHFEQVLFVSHDSVFDPAMFPYHVYMDNGLVVESNLPVVAAAPTPPLPAASGDEEMIEEEK